MTNTFKAVHRSENTQMELCSFKVSNNGTLKRKILFMNLFYLSSVSLLRTQRVGILEVNHTTHA